MKASNILPDHPAYNLDAHFKYLLKLRSHFPSEEENRERVEGVAVTLIKLEMVEPLLPYLRRFVHRLFYDNTLMYYDNLEDHPRQRDILIALEDRLLDKNREDRAFDAIQKFYLRLFKLLPEFAKLRHPKRQEHDAPDWSGAAMVPLTDIVDMHSLFLIARDEFSIEDGPDKPTFFITYRKMNRNVIRAAGYGETYRGQSIDIQKCDPRTLFHDTPFEELFQAQVPFTVPDKYWPEHCAIFAGSGHGKTQTLQALIAQFLERPDPPAMFIIDSMGTMLKLIRQKYGHLSDKLVVLDPTAPTSPQLNFFQLHASPSLYFYLFKAIDQSLTQRQATMVSYFIALMQKVEGANLDTLRELCESTSKTIPYPKAVAKLEKIEQDFFRNQYLGNDPLVKQTKQQIAQRLYTVGRMGTFNKMFNAPVNEFDARRCIEEKKIVLVNTDVNNLDEASPVFGRFIIAQCLAAARSRADLPPDQRHLALLIVDEAKAYVDETTERILSDARQFGLSMVQASQHLSQMPDGVKRAILGNTAIKFCAALTHNDATILSRDMRCSAEFIKDMRSYDRKEVEWACHVRNYTDKAIKLTVPMGVMERMPNNPATHTSPASTTTQGSASPQPTTNAQPPPTSEIELVIKTARRIETLLETHYGATGGGLHKKIDSIETKLPENLIFAGRYIATMRNNVMHVDDFSLPERDRFLRYAKLFEDHFSNAQAAPSTKKFVPGIGMRVRVIIPSGKDWYPNGATIVKISIEAGCAWVDPTPYAQAGDPEWCFEVPKAPVLFSELAPYQPPTKPPEAGETPQSPPPTDDPSKPSKW
jgi:Helicase HerA, central domain